jgi:RNA polymerase sigma-70 factor (ECF subfamily)
VITSPAGDEGMEYLAQLHMTADRAGVDLRYVADRFGPVRGPPRRPARGGPRPRPRAARRYRRLDLAEDGLADAFEAAARTWTDADAPANGAAWLLTAARRRIVDRLRSEQVLARSMPLLAVEADVTRRAQRVMADAGERLVDERLRLVLLCTHPRLSREAAAALSLRLVLGVPTAEIARLFVQSTPTTAARLTRARKKLAGEGFSLPCGPELADRVDAVADVAYLAFTAGYAPSSGDVAVRTELAGEAIRLVRVLREVAPADADRTDVDALLALMLLQHSRRDARVRDGALVLLPDQDRTSWHHDEIAEALELLAPLASAPATPYLLQALAAAEHGRGAPARAPGGGRRRRRTAPRRR